MHLITNEALIAILREQIRLHGGPSRYAKRLGVSCAFVSAVVGGSKYASGRILQDLGYERIVGFRKTGAEAELANGVPIVADAPQPQGGAPGAK